MSGAFAEELAVGVRNLLVECAGVEAGHRVLVVAEDPGLGWYDAAAPGAVAAGARRLGAKVSEFPAGGPAESLPDDLAEAIRAHDVVIFFARLGDQDRFGARDPAQVTVMSYARTAPALASSFGTLPHGEMQALKARVEHRLTQARRLDVSCPLGTSLTGEADMSAHEDVTIRRFPMCVPRPVPAGGFSGRVAVADYLTPTGSRVYSPASVALDRPVFAIIERGRITGFEGDAETMARVHAHYDHVAGLFGIDRDAVHSWHAGIHPGCHEAAPDLSDPDRWSNTLFGCPRYLHFHTCGNCAPGEICWMVAEPTIRADGEAVWDGGRLIDAPADA